MEFTYRFLDVNEYHLATPFFDECEAPRLDPNFSRVLGAFTPEGELAGFVSLQLVAHAEPIFVEPAYRNSGLGLNLTQKMDDYCQALGLPGLYVQPTNLAAQKLASCVGFEPSEHSLWVKMYDDNYKDLIAFQAEGE